MESAEACPMTDSPRMILWSMEPLSLTPTLFTSNSSHKNGGSGFLELLESVN